MGEMWDEVKETLCDLDFIQAKCAAGMTYDLVGVYDMALNSLPEAQKEKQKEQKLYDVINDWTKQLLEYANSNSSLPYPEPPDCTVSVITARSDNLYLTGQGRFHYIYAFATFLRNHSHIFMLWPKLVHVQAYNYAKTGPVVQKSEDRLLAGDKLGAPWLRFMDRPKFIERVACIATLHGHTDTVNAVSVSADGHRAISASSDGTIRVWDLQNTRCVHVLKEHTASVTTVDLNINGSRALSGGEDQTLRFWDIDNGSCLSVFKNAGSVVDLSLSANATKVISSDGSYIYVWNLEKSSYLKRFPEYPSSFTANQVSCLAISANGLLGVSGNQGKATVGHSYGADYISDIGEVVLWKLDSQESFTLFRSRSVRYDLAPIKTVVMTPDGGRVIAALAYPEYPDKTGTDQHGYGNIIIWDVKETRDRDGHTRFSCPHKEFEWKLPIAMSLTPDGRFALAGYQDGTLRLWNSSNGDCISEHHGHSAAVTSVAIAADGYTAISGSQDRTVRLWDIRGKSIAVTRPVSWQKPREFYYDIRLIDRHIQAQADLKDVVIVDVKTKKKVRRLVGHRGLVNSVALSREGRYAFSGSNDKTIKLWDIITGCFLSFDHINEEEPFNLAPDGRTAVCGSLDGSIRFFNTSTGLCSHSISKHSGAVLTVAFSPDGLFVASGGQDSALHIWNTHTYECIQTLGEKGHTVLSIKITPDGRYVISASEDYTVRIWDLQTGNLLRTQYFDPPIARINHIQPNGSIQLVDYVGNILSLVLEELNTGKPILTAARCWVWENLDTYIGYFENNFTISCGWCDEEFKIPNISSGQLGSQLGTELSCQFCTMPFILNTFTFDLQPDKEKMVKPHGPTGLHHPKECPSSNAESGRKALAEKSGPSARDAAERIDLDNYKFCPECDPTLPILDK